MANSYLRMFLLCILFFTVPVTCHAWSGKVVHVADGDTVTVERDGKRVKVRLYGIDTPEKSQWYGQNVKAGIRVLEKRCRSRRPRPLNSHRVKR